MKIITCGESYSSSEGRWLGKWFLGLKIFTAIVIILVSIYYIAKHEWLWGIIGVVIMFLFVVRNKKYKWFKWQLANYKRGETGEEIVLEYLKKSQFFNDDYLYIRNYRNKEACSGDIDGMLLGPRGLFLLEVKDWQGIFRVSGTDFYRHISGYLYKLYKSPIDQLSDNKERLLRYLESRGITLINPRPFVVLVDGEVKHFNGKTHVLVVGPDEIADKIFTSPNQNLSMAEIDKILNALEINKLCN